MEVAQQEQRPLVGVKRSFKQVMQRDDLVPVLLLAPVALRESCARPDGTAPASKRGQTFDCGLAIGGESWCSSRMNRTQELAGSSPASATSDSA
jgi:hypothetical protein